MTGTDHVCQNNVSAYRAWACSTIPRVRGRGRVYVFLVGTLFFATVRSQCLKIVLLLSHTAGEHSTRAREIHTISARGFCARAYAHAVNVAEKG